MLNATRAANLSYQENIKGMFSYYYRIHSVETLAIQLKQTNLFTEELVKDH